MSDTDWFWAETDGTAMAITLDALRASLSLAALPPIVLVWHTGLVEWLPAYLLPELAKTLGTEAVEIGELDEGITEPPPAPVEWYVECYGGAQPTSLSELSASLNTTHRLKTSQYDPQLMSTVLGGKRPLPIGAFRSVDDYLAHIRSLRDGG